MKTTMILPDPLLTKAKSLAHKKGTSVTRLMEDALREYISAHSGSQAKAEWQIAPVGKGGYASPEFEGNWQKIREVLYDDK